MERQIQAEGAEGASRIIKEKNGRGSGRAKHTYSAGSRGQSKSALRTRLIIRTVLICICAVSFFIHTDFYIAAGSSGETHIYLKRLLAVIILSPAAILLPSFLERVRPFHTLPKWFRVILVLFSIPAGVVLALAEAERIHGYNFFALGKTAIECNGIIAVSVFLIIMVITGRTGVSLLVTYIVIAGFSATNFYVDYFRGEALSAADLYVVGTAMNVAGDYHLFLTFSLWEACFAFALLYCLLCCVPVRGRIPRHLFLWIAGAAATVFVSYSTWHVLTETKWPLRHGIKVKLFDPMITYKKNGELLNFVRSFYYLKIDEPEGYTEDSASQLMESKGYESDSADGASADDSPNIIYIMNESLMDFSVYSDVLPISEDVMPFIHSLKGQDNASVGWLYVNVFGGRTANTEYETVTGASQAFMPSYTVPYAMYVRSPQPSLVRNMRDMGYSGCLAFHPYYADGYNRPTAYQNLGFTDFISLEDIEDSLTDSDYLRNYVSDSADFREVEKLYEESQKDGDTPFFLFNVTMQNHGSYTGDYANFPLTVSLGEQYAEDDRALRYINLVKYTDEAFRELTEYFSNVDRHTIIVMYGDHQPGLGEKFYRKLYGGKKYRELSASDRLQRYRTPLVVWANYDINEGGQLDSIFDGISVNYLSAEITDLAGLPLTAFQKYLLDLRQSIPVLTERGIFDSSGAFYKFSDKTSPYYDALEEYRTLVYNYQFDKEGRDDSLFELKAETNSLDEDQG